MFSITTTFLLFFISFSIKILFVQFLNIFHIFIFESIQSERYVCAFFFLFLDSIESVKNRFRSKWKMNFICDTSRRLEEKNMKRTKIDCFNWRKWKKIEFRKSIYLKLVFTLCPFPRFSHFRRLSVPHLFSIDSRLVFFINFSRVVFFFTWKYKKKKYKNRTQTRPDVSSSKKITRVMKKTNIDSERDCWKLFVGRY